MMPRSRRKPRIWLIIAVRRSAKELNFASWHDYSRAKALRKRRRDAPESLPTHDFAEAIFTVVRSLGTKGADDAAQRHALALATVGLGLPHGAKRVEIDTLLALPQPYATKQRLLIAAAMVGEIVPADALVAGIQKLLEAGKKESWRLREDRGELMGWVELFAYSDRPEAVLGVIDLLPEDYRRYPRALHRLLSALGQSPHERALDVLQALARRDPRMIADHDWLDALIRLGTEESARALVALICGGEFAVRGVDSFRLSDRLARFAEEFPAIKDEMVQRYQRMIAGPPKSMIESALMELADPPIILALIGGYAAEGRSYDGGLSRAIRKVALGQRPVEGWAAGAYQEFSVPLTALRQQLFGIAAANEPRSALAERCLLTIEKLRDEHGRIDDEPRHPNIDSGQAWPFIE